MVLTVIAALPLRGGLRSGLLLPRERAFRRLHTACPGYPHAGLLRGVGPAHTRVSGRLRRPEAGREGGAGEAQRFTPARGPWGSQARVTQEEGTAPASKLLSSPPSQFEEGYLKTGTPAGPGEEQERETGGWDCRQPGSRVHPGAGRSGAPGTDRAAGAGGARGYFVLLCPASSPAEVRERQGRGLSREGAQLSQNKAWTATTPRTPWVRREARSQRSELFPSVPTSVSFSLSLLKWVICWFI